MPRILLVEDNLEIRSLLQLALHRDGWEVLTARDGVEAISILDTVAPDVVLLDLEMPRMDGWGVLARREVEPNWRSIPVIAMSAELRYEAGILDLGANAFLAKPFTIEDLLAALVSIKESLPPEARW